MGARKRSRGHRAVPVLAATALFAALGCTEASAQSSTPFGDWRGVTAAQRPAKCLTDHFQQFVSHEGVNVRVWYLAGADYGPGAAQRVAGQIDGTIWPKFAALLGRVPPSDEGEPCPHGPDGKLDVYLTTARRFGEGASALQLREGQVAITHPFDRAEPCAPLKPVIVIAHPSVERWVLAHELFHAFQAAYARAEACTEYSFWEEVTATWAADHVYRNDNEEHRQRNGIRRPDFPIWLSRGGWVFPYYLTRKYDDPGIVRRIEEAGEVLVQDQHVDATIPGGFRERFPEFALYAWNQAPIPDTSIQESFRHWDRFREVPRPDGREVERRRLTLGGRRSKNVPWPIVLRVLSRDYRHYTITDRKIRLLRFKNPQAGELFGVSAFVRIGRRWRVEYWTGRDEVEFCRDFRTEDVREVIIALSNSNYNNRLRARPKLELRNRCESKAVLQMGGSQTFTFSTEDCNEQNRIDVPNWGLRAEFEIPSTFAQRSDRFEANAGSGGGTYDEVRDRCFEPDRRSFPLSWGAGSGGGEVLLRTTRTGAGLRAEVTLLPLFELVGSEEFGGISWMPYFAPFSSPEGTAPQCGNPQGTVSEERLRARRFTVMLSGNCDLTNETGGGDPGDPIERNVAVAGGTLEVTR
jgi:hypothetical protein